MRTILILAALLLGAVGPVAARQAAPPAEEGAPAAAGEPAAAPPAAAAKKPEPPAPPPDPVPVGFVAIDPEAAAKREIGASCLQVGYPEEFGQRRDINGDGEPDAIFLYNVSCDGFYGAFCGMERCAGSVFASLPDGRFIKTSLDPYFQESQPYKGRPAVTVRLTGSACGRGRPVCRGLRVWNGSDFVPPSQVDAASAPVAPSAAPKPPAEPEPPADIDQTDAEATAALFAARAGEPLSPEAEARIDALAAGGQLRVSPSWRAFEPTEEWSYEPTGRGRARSWVLSFNGSARLMIACRAGDGGAALALSGLGGSLAELAAPGVSSPVALWVGGEKRAEPLMRYAPSQRLWVARFPADSPILEWMRRGSEAQFARGGEELAYFSLNGSSRALLATLRACGLR